MAPGRARAEVRKLKTMMEDLKQMREELCPDEREKALKEEMKTFDDFKRKKHALNKRLMGIREDVERLNELRKKMGRDERDTTTIRLQSENSERLRLALDEFNELKRQLDKDAAKTGRKKLDEKELANRRHLVLLMGEELRELTSQNARVKMPLSEGEEALQARVSRRKAMDNEARERREKSRKSRKLGRGESAIDDADLEAAVSHVGTEQEQDKMLEEISKGLEELKELAHEASKQLTIQKAMLDQVDDKIDTTMRQFKTANSRLKNLLEESGGMSRWCPILILAVVILALVGYAFNIGGI